ncbi:MAG TPA: hypothetical protein VIL57_00905 [Bacteroidia bacterium]
MTGIRKRFDLDLYNENDNKAKNKAKELLVNSGFDVEDNPKKRGVDLLIFKDGKHIANIECEIKKVWKGPVFRYPTIQFPERKKKFAELEIPTVFLMFNEDLSAHLAVRGSDLLKSPLVEVPNKYCFKGELFFQVPLEQTVFNDIIKVLKSI